MMCWVFERELQWLNQDDGTIDANLDLLIQSNPVVNNAVDRPINNEIFGDVKSWLSRKAKSDPGRPNLESYFDDRAFQQALKRFLTEQLSKAHYLYMLSLPTAGPIDVSVGQFWAPPSYFVCFWKCDEAGKRQNMEML